MDPLVTVGIVWLLSLIFGFWGSSVARRKGNKFFANVCIIFALVFLGFIGIAAFFLPDLSPKMAVPLKEKCPKCGGTQGYVIGASMLDASTGKELPRPMGNYVAIAVLAVLALVLHMTEVSSPLLAIAVMALPIRSLLQYYSAKKTPGIKHKCATCQNQWVRARES